MATLATVRTAIQRQGDFEGDPHKATAEINEGIARAFREGWSILLGASKSYFMAKKDFELTGGIGANTYDLAVNVVDFFEALKLERDSAGGGRYDEDIPPFDILERNSLGSRGFTVYDTTLQVDPAGDAGGNYRLWYAYKPADPVADGTVLKDPTGLLEQYVIDTVVLRLRFKEDSDTAELMQLRADLEAKMRRLASSRQRTTPGVDVRRGRPILSRGRAWYR